LKVPIYEYQCDDCEHTLEKLQKISDDPLQDCPECGEQGLRKLISAVAFRLKGSGWYETDFKDKKDQKNLSNSDNKSPSGSKSKKSDSSDSKKSESTASDSSAINKSTEAKKPATTSASSDS
jgi:putative FmdB family regulatory protein